VKVCKEGKGGFPIDGLINFVSHHVVIKSLFTTMHLKYPDIVKFELKVQMDVQWGFHMVYDYAQIIIVCQDDYLFNTILVLCLFKDIYIKFTILAKHIAGPN